MMTASKHKAGLIAFFLLAGTIGLLLLVHVSSRQQDRCGTQSFDNVSLIKLI
jgi:hypothetical protein